MTQREVTAYPVDAVVISKVLGGEKALYEVLMRRHNASLYRIGRAHGLGHTDVEDLMQDTYVAAYLSLGKFRNESIFRTWLTRIMINKCLQKLQKSSFRNEVNGSDTIDITMNSTPLFSNGNFDTEKQVLTRELSRLLEKSIEELPLKYRTVFVLREMEEMSIAEAASALDISEVNVKVRLNRAKAMLMEQLKQWYPVSQMYEFNLVYCDRVVERVVEKIQK